jgi:GTP-binding protein HflX
MGGMAGARGPGETASELLARKLDSRMAELKKALSKLSTSAKTQRRGRADCARVALVGYTNAGKTSVINALTGSDLSAKDRPFETLDTTSRSLTRHGGDVVVSDTVGFVRRLPEGLLASFESTLEEVAEADLLVLVVDASDPEARLHVETTVGVLERIGADRVPRFFYFNKLDRDVPEGQRACSALAGNASWFCGSTSDIGAMNELRSRILHAVRGREETRTFDVPYQASKALSLLYARCRVLETEALATALRLRVEGPAAVLSLVERALHEVTR